MVKAAAATKSRDTGIGSTLPASTTTSSAKPPTMIYAMTRSPGLNFRTSDPTRSTMPATSPPGAKGSGGFTWYLSWMIRVSGKLTPAAMTRIATSVGPGSRDGTSPRIKVSGGPKALQRSAFMSSSISISCSHREARYSMSRSQPRPVRPVGEIVRENREGAGIDQRHDEGGVERQRRVLAEEYGEIEDQGRNRNDGAGDDGPGDRQGAGGDGGAEQHRL